MDKSLAILSFNTLCSSRLCCLGLEGRQDAQVIYVICLRFSSWNNHLCSGITCGAKQLSHKPSSFVILKKYFFKPTTCKFTVCVHFMTTVSKQYKCEDAVCNSPTPTYFTQTGVCRQLRGSVLLGRQHSSF